MNKARLNNIIAVAVFFAALPAVALAQTTPAATTPATTAVPNGFSGIFSCNQNGANAMSVGALGATGGVYVPVADATVELNTGTLVYKECVLREVVDAQRIAATAGFTQQTISQIQTARSGSPLYVVQPVQEIVTADNQIVQDDVQSNGTLNTLNSSFQGPVAQAVVRAYVTTTQQGNSELTCPYQGNLQALDTGQAFSLDGLAALQNPACNQDGATLLASGQIVNDLALGNSTLNQEWLWGNGLYPVTTGGPNPLKQQIVTPSSLVNSSYTQVVTSAFNQLQNANDLGQMVGALFAGISTQVTSPNGGGLTGISQPVGNSPSYLAQAVAQTTQNLQQTVDNAALVNLDAALTIEQGYFTIMTGIANDVTQAISQLRGAEATCWTQIIQNVCATALTAQNTCTEVTGACTTDADGNQTCPTGATLHVATSTAFSQAIIDAQLTSLGQTTATNIQTSQTALNLINNLIQGVSSSGADSQSVAIAQLNSLIVNHQLHTQSDLTTAQQQKTSVETFLSGSATTPPGGLISNTESLWAGTDPNNTNGPPNGLPWDGSTNPGTGWCNFKNPTTLQMWENKWSQ